MLSYLCGSDAIDDWVETAREEEVHRADENSNGCREIISDPVGQESHKNDGQAEGDNHNVSHTGVKSFDT